MHEASAEIAHAILSHRNKLAALGNTGVMTDDIPAQITLFPPNTDLETTHWGSLAPTLWHAGLIWHDYEQVAFDLPQPELRIWCTFTDRHAFDTWRTHERVVSHCSEILKTSIHVTEIVTPWERHDHICRCNDSTVLVLTGHGFGNRKSNILCCDCLGYYPNYRINELLGDHASRLHSWSLVYGHVYDIWMLTADLETWALNELQAPTSQINRSGLECTRLIEHQLEKPVWYNIFVESDSRIDMCPSCSTICDHPKWSKKRFVCDRCRLVY